MAYQDFRRLLKDPEEPLTEFVGHLRRDVEELIRGTWWQARAAQHLGGQGPGGGLHGERKSLCPSSEGRARDGRVHWV